MALLLYNKCTKFLVKKENTIMQIKSKINILIRTFTLPHLKVTFSLKSHSCFFPLANQLYLNGECFLKLQFNLLLVIMLFLGTSSSHGILEIKCVDCVFHQGFIWAHTHTQRKIHTMAKIHTVLHLKEPMHCGLIHALPIFQVQVLKPSLPVSQDVIILGWTGWR